ncbi:MAG: demethoxyubiquinone hydroxylase family protein [Maricaulaceae bacterium]
MSLADGVAALDPPNWLIAALRSDQAGETGAVEIYKGVLAVSRDEGVRAFAERHQATEARHLAVIERWLPTERSTRLLGLWRVMGWLTGAIPALLGPKVVYATIDAVETFVDKHYQDQIDRLEGDPAWAALRADLIACQADELEHRDEARAASDAKTGPLLSLWCALVGFGSAQAVKVAEAI